MQDALTLARAVASLGTSLLRVDRGVVVRGNRRQPEKTPETTEAISGTSSSNRRKSEEKFWASLAELKRAKRCLCLLVKWLRVWQGRSKI